MTRRVFWLSAILLSAIIATPSAKPRETEAITIMAVDSILKEPLPGVRITLVGVDGTTTERLTGSDGAAKFPGIKWIIGAIRGSMRGFRNTTIPVSERLDLSHVTVEMDEYQLVSIVRLVANPEPLNGRPVIVRGVASVEFENTALYMSVGDLEHYVTKSAIWIDLEGFPDVKRLHKKYVAVQGTFEAPPRWSSRWSGRLVQVESIGRIRQ